MANISDYKDEYKQLTGKEWPPQCSLCGGEIVRGGFWSGNEDVFACEKCASRMVDILMDALDDAGAIDFEDTDEVYAKIHGIVDERIKKRIEIHELRKKNR